jgi:hypothetical protein
LSDTTAIPTKVRTELQQVHADFEALLDAVPEDALARQSRNPGWTNGELLAHMLFGFIIVRALTPMVRLWGRFPQGISSPFAWLLNLFTGPFNRVNAIGARLQGRVFTRERLRAQLRSTLQALLQASERIGDSEWQRGMHIPSRWDPNFAAFMTLEEIYHYPVAHYAFHLEQLSLPKQSAG